MTELHLMAQMFERQMHTVKIEYKEKAECYILFVWDLSEHLTKFIFDKEGSFDKIDAF